MPMIWAVLPSALRRNVRPVAAANYWLANQIRAFVGPKVFNCVLVDRRPEVNDKPMDKIIEALDDGSCPRPYKMGHQSCLSIGGSGSFV